MRNNVAIVTEKQGAFSRDVGPHGLAASSEANNSNARHRDSACNANGS